MHIKQITISGFKSYREAVGAGPFSAGHSVVVGRNGSGKSNFFDAVRFILSDTYASLRAEDRVALLHEGAGASVLSAYVEIVFDNSDGRLPFDKDEVALRRMVGLKKDEYVLDRKNVTRTEVFNLLESAGFSRSNPYYIVQQGKVAALCGMSDKQRLDLLQEVAGTRVYDERRTEVLRIMDEDDKKRRKVGEVVETLEERLSNLEGEKDELKEFQKLEKEKRALEYTIYMKELHEAKEVLGKLEDDRAEETTRSNSLHSELMNVEQEINEGEDLCQTIKSSLVQSKEEHKHLDARHKSFVKAVAKQQVEVKEGEGAIAAAGEAKASAQVELVKLETDMADRRRKLAPLKEKFKAALAEEDELKGRIADSEARILALRVKSDRGNQFSTLAERDEYLSQEISNAKTVLETADLQRRDAVADVTRLEQAIESAKRSVENRTQELAPLSEQLTSEEQELAELKKERDSTYNARQAIWREESTLNESMKNLSSEIRKLEGQKRSAFGSRTYRAIQEILSYSKENSDPSIPEGSVFGTVADLIQVDSTFVMAAEVTGANALTHVVVSSDAVSAALISHLQKAQAGRLTFVPLNQISRNARPSRFDQGTGDEEAIPLASRIKCADVFRPAVNAIFGDTLVTRTIPIATRLSKSFNSNCVTLDGDQVNKRGAMTGGYIAPVNSKLTSAQLLADACVKMKSYVSKKSDLSAQISSLTSKISQILSKIEVVSSKQRSTAIAVSSSNKAVSRLEHEIKSDCILLENARKRVADNGISIEATNKRIRSLEAELGTELRSFLSQADAVELGDLVQGCTVFNENLKGVQKVRVELEVQVQEVEAELKGNLERRAVELRDTISDETEGEVTSRELEDLRSLLRNAETEERTTAVQMQALEKSISESSKKLNTTILSIKALREKRSVLKNTISVEMTKLTTLRDTRASALGKKTAAERHIRELGSVPGGIEKYRSNKNNSDLIKRLNRVNQGLQGFRRVNKKALEQYIHFKEQRQILEKKRLELEKAADSIRALIEHLGKRKDEDIHRTFKGVSKCFTDVFSELVPGGLARLVMVKSASRNEGNTPSQIEYCGVAMKVKFGGRGGEEYMIQQLSGGQKSVVAMALIFAIQRLDPAPFYLFDEVDANLDAVYRHAVAALIRKQADQGTQFITTTFRSELVNAGDRWFGVSHKNKVSAIQEVDKDSALSFITSEPGR